jgi:predicted ATPase
VKFVNAATSDDSEANITQTYIYNKDLIVVTGDAVIYEKTNEEEITISKSANPEKSD